MLDSAYRRISDGFNPISERGTPRSQRVSVFANEVINQRKGNVTGAEARVYVDLVRNGELWVGQPENSGFKAIQALPNEIRANLRAAINGEKGVGKEGYLKYLDTGKEPAPVVPGLWNMPLGGLTAG
jgi:hypothetical protein